MRDLEQGTNSSTVLLQLCVRIRAMMCDQREKSEKEEAMIFADAYERQESIKNHTCRVEG